MKGTNEFDVYGVDIGNAYCQIALLGKEESNEPRIMLPVGIQNLNERLGMPSAAYVVPPDGSNVVVFNKDGGNAERRIRRDPKHGVRAIKTRLSEKQLTLPDIEASISPYDVYAKVVRDLVALGNLQRANEGCEPIYRMLLTYPASFNNFPRGLDILNSIKRHVENIVLDGHRLQVIERMPEPAAVGIDYLDYLRRSAPENARITEDSYTALVYDLGHGTFDAAVITAGGNKPYKVWATDGLSDCGGRDFDVRFYDEVIGILRSRFDYELQDDTERESLQETLIAAKHELSASEDTVVRHQSRLDGTYFEFTVTRDQFESLTSDLCMRTVELCQQMISDQQDNGRIINAIILSGGASQMPMIKRALEECISPQIPICLFRPNSAIALGAARYARSIAGSAVDEYAQQSLKSMPVATLHTRSSYGILVNITGQLEGEVLRVLAKETELPAESEPIDLVLGSGRIDIRVYRPKTESGNIRCSTEQCINLAWLHFDISKPGNYRARVRVAVDYNISVELSGKDVVLVQSTAER